jgi:hypothetical protein
LSGCGTPPTPSPVATPPPPLAYELTCGQLERSGCEADAAEIVRQHPTNAVVSISFTDQCGSAMVVLADGTRIGIMKDCYTGG